MVDPKIWGPGAWKYLHTAAAGCESKEEVEAFVAFIPFFAKTIPCKKCREHFLANCRKIDIRSYMADAESLLLWTYRMHDAVNYAQIEKGLRDPKDRPTWVTVRAMYFDVGDDGAVVGNGELDDALCEEICSSSIVKTTPKVQNGMLNVKSANASRRPRRVAPR